jgi:hypothetical protein
MFGFPLGLLTDAERARRAAANQIRADYAFAQAKAGGLLAWDPQMRFSEHMYVDATSYKLAEPLFDVAPVPLSAAQSVRDWLPEDRFAHAAVSPCGAWHYTNMTYPADTPLRIYSGTRSGKLWFDGDVTVPVLRARCGATVQGMPWMSLTPMEHFSLRNLARFAKGTVVIAGLGLGYLNELCDARNKVERIIVVERARGLVDWVWPLIEARHTKPVEIIVGDAYEVVPKLTADVALVDIYPTYGGNKWHRPHPNIGRVVCWGAAELYA